MCMWITPALGCLIAGLSSRKGRIVEIAAMDLDSGECMQTLVNIFPEVVRSSLVLTAMEAQLGVMDPQNVMPTERRCLRNSHGRCTA